MFASMWKSVVRRWRRLGHLPDLDTVAQRAPEAFQGKSRLSSERVSAPRMRTAKAPRGLRTAVPRELQIAKIKSAGRRIDAARPTTITARAASPRPCTVAQTVRRTAPARHVWLEVRTPAPRRAVANIVALPARAPRTLEAITAAA